jgi:hypothetical protein
MLGIDKEHILNMLLIHKEYPFEDNAPEQSKVSTLEDREIVPWSLCLERISRRLFGGAFESPQASSSQSYSSPFSLNLPVSYARSIHKRIKTSLVLFSRIDSRETIEF